MRAGGRATRHAVDVRTETEGGWVFFLRGDATARRASRVFDREKCDFRPVTFALSRFSNLLTNGRPPFWQCQPACAIESCMLGFVIVALTSELYGLLPEQRIAREKDLLVYGSWAAQASLADSHHDILRPPRITSTIPSNYSKCYAKVHPA